MSESANKLRSEIDVTEFERRLRGPAPSATYEDPLAELARLVDGKTLSDDDPFRELFAQPRPAPARRAAAPALGREHAFFADLRGSLDVHQGGDLPADVIAGRAPPVAAAEPAVAEAEYPDPAAWADQDATYADELQPRAKRSRRPLYAMGAIVCAGLVGIGASFAMRSKVPGAQELALVKAPAGPVKVQPQNPGGVDVPNQSASILDRTAGSSVTKVVSREEQPVDLEQQVKQMRVITLGGSRDGTVSAVNTQRAAAVPVPPPPAASVSTTNNGFPEPKRVKTVSVRPDGSLLAADASPGIEPPPAPAVRPASPVASAETGSLPKSSTPKSTVRVAATTPRIDPPPAAAPVAGDQSVATTPAPAKPKLAAVKPKPEPVKVASAEDNTAPDTTRAPAAANGGGFAVQLSAPGSEKEALSISNRLGQKFANVLDGHQPSVVKADVGEKSIYRVRVGSLSREEANSLCGKIKAKGGDCFVAKN
jgi:hypothetical protein